MQVKHVKHVREALVWVTEPLGRNVLNADARDPDHDTFKLTALRQAGFCQLRQARANTRPCIAGFWPAHAGFASQKNDPRHLCRRGVAGAGGWGAKESYVNPRNRCYRAPSLPPAPPRVLLVSTLTGRFLLDAFEFVLVRAKST